MSRSRGHPPGPNGTTTTVANRPNMFSRTGAVLSLTRCFRHHQPSRSLSLVSSSTLTAHLATRSDLRQCQSRFHQQKRLVSTATTESSCIKMTGVKKYQIVERGAPNSTDYRVFFSKYPCESKIVSSSCCFGLNLTQSGELLDRRNRFCAHESSIIKVGANAASLFSEAEVNFNSQIA